jgi:CheY-like chemotaxis protein
MAIQKSILLIDDDRDDQEFFADAMNEFSSPAPWLIADNGQHAFDLLAEPMNKPRLIFLDLNMPVMDGFQFLKLIKAHATLHEIPIVVLTTSFNDCERCYQMGAALYIPKPTSLKIYTKIIADLLSRDVEKERDELRKLYKLP